MINIIINWWRSQQFKLALRRGNTQKAVKILHDIQKSGARFSWVEKLFKEQIQLENILQNEQRQNKILQKKVAEVSHKLDETKFQYAFDYPSDSRLQPQALLVADTLKKLELFNYDNTKITSTGIDRNIFDDLEKSLVKFLDDELQKMSSKSGFLLEFKMACEDINALKKGVDPDYKYSITPYIYFIRYFLNGVYSAYIAWFLVYKNGLLKSKINLLDIGAGSGAIFYGLFAFLKSVDIFEELSQIHISYCSFEKQKLLQYHGLQFWRKYAKTQSTPAVNAYWRFSTSDIFEYANELGDVEQLPSNFYDFVSISHCIFADKNQRIISHQKYKDIFQRTLKTEGYVLIVVQGRRLYQSYEWRLTEDESQEKQLIEIFVEELGVKLVWYKYITSTDQRTPMTASEFSRFAKEKLPKQKYMSVLAKQYLVVNHDLSYVLDDYVILAQK
jgi:hypothetical protein